MDLGSLVAVLCVLLHVSEGRPNIVYILTDDQDIKLGGLSNQTSVQTLLADEGMSFVNAFVTTPVCCPSRSSILTGKYVHNHKTYENSIETGCNAPSWRSLNEQKTLGVYLNKAGYTTGFFGKYLNNYGFPKSGVGPEHIPPGWDTWFALIGNSKYYHYSVSNNGMEQKHGNSYKDDYFTDLVRNQTVDFIHRAGKDTGSPFFAYVATPAPHRDAVPAPQYDGIYKGKKAPRTDSYGQQGMDKHWLISEATPALTNDSEKLIDDLYQKRMETLFSVDDLVRDVIAALKANNLLDNTYIIYNSDHGYHLGQFNQRGEKRQVYDENIRVPLIVRGPGVAANTTTEALALNIDMAPTFLDLAGIPTPMDMDGESLMPTLHGKNPEEYYQFAVEYFGEGAPYGNDVFLAGPYTPFYHDCKNNTFFAVRAFSTSLSAEVHNIALAQFFLKDSLTPPEDRKDLYFTEMYNLTTDPWQMTNLKPNGLDSHQVNLFSKAHSSLGELTKCSGATCRILRTRKP